MGGAGLVFDNLGINMVSLVGKAPVPSLLYLNRIHGEEIQVEVDSNRRERDLEDRARRRVRPHRIRSQGNTPHVMRMIRASSPSGGLPSRRISEPSFPLRFPAGS